MRARDDDTEDLECEEVAKEVTTLPYYHLRPQAVRPWPRG